MEADVAAFKWGGDVAARAAWAPLASAGDAEVQDYLGQPDAKDEGVVRDLVQALRWFRAVAGRPWEGPGALLGGEQAFPLCLPRRGQMSP